jgi:hypothetical protein
MLIERRSVSHKTPLDGKLEISASAATQLELRHALIVRVNGEKGEGRIEKMVCTCGKGGGESHPHHFLVSSLFTHLQPGSDVQMSVAEASGEVVVQPIG